MTLHRAFVYNDRLPVAFVDPIQEFVSTMHANFVVTLANPTTLQIVAGPDNAQVAVGINGRWRWISATINAAHPGGGATTYDVYVTASDNSFAPSGLPAGQPPETDSTNYSFGLVIRAVGSPPTTALYRKIGTCTWDGTQITDFNITVGSSRHHQQHEPGGSDALNWSQVGQVIHLVGTLAARPAAGVSNGLLYLATDVLGGTVYRSNGAAWVQQAAGVVHASVHLPGGADPMAWEGSVHARGTLGARPAASAANQGLFYFVIDVASGTMYRSTGSAWEATGAGVSAALAPAAHAASHAPTGSDALPWASGIHGAGTLGARPAAVATNAGYLYLATDTNGGTLYRSDGAAWAKAALGATEQPSNTVIAQAIHPSGTLAARPAASSANQGFYYFATDQGGGTLYQNQSGSAWAQISLGLADQRLTDQRTPLNDSVTNAKILNGAIDGTTKMVAGSVAGGANFGTVFPTTGLFNGYRYTIFLGGVVYESIYRADLDATYPWHVTGAAILNEVAANESTASLTYVNLGSAGPSVAIPRAGVYNVVLGFWGNGVGAVTDRVYMSYDIGGTGASDADAVIQATSSGGTLAESSSMRQRGKTFSSTLTLTAKYRTNGGSTQFFGNRHLSVTPLRLI